MKASEWIVFFYCLQTDSRITAYIAASEATVGMNPELMDW